jgi:AAA15 family ATPase/GTPase
MKITAIKITNVKGFQSATINRLSRNINVFIGPNNAGKSTILNSIFLLQRKNVFTKGDTTLGKSNGQIELFFEGGHLPEIIPESHMDKITFSLQTNSISLVRYNGSGNKSLATIQEEEPHNLIYPYLSKRKVGNYSDAMNEANANSVSGNFTNLYSKIDRLVTPEFQPANSQYIAACKEVLGFPISSRAKGAGKQAVYFIHNLEHIPLTAMGEGVANILGLIVDLCIAEDRIFLIEEPENDIHPKALKALLKLIIEKSSTNQFFISTHSNIVMKYLGSVSDSKVFNVTNDGKDEAKPKLFVSKIEEVPNNPEDRRAVLEDLGYDFFDFDLWKGWLFLEESSAEVIIRDYLIGWFIPGLKNKIKTFSAGGTSKISGKFEDFNKLFVFLHLQPTYKNKVWVLIDGGEEEKKIIEEMKGTYSNSGWSASNFNQFKEHDFEKYYPSRFQNEVTIALDTNDKRKAKKDLLNKVKNWISLNPDEAKEEFKTSAAEIIEHLKAISKQLNNT